MTTLRTTRRFERDVERARKRQKDLDKLWTVVARLLAGERLDQSHHPHRLAGRWKRFWECHIEPDSLLIWHLDNDVLTLAGTGTHSDLFG